MRRRSSATKVRSDSRSCIGDYDMGHYDGRTVGFDVKKQPSEQPALALLQNEKHRSHRRSPQRGSVRALCPAVEHARPAPSARAAILPDRGISGYVASAKLGRPRPGVTNGGLE